MSDQKLPLIFALKHLHVCIPAGVAGTADFARKAELRQGDAPVPAASDARVATFAKEACEPALPSGVELKLLELSCPGWTTDAMYAFAGLTAFGAKDLKRARACAQHALAANSQGRLARQLLRILDAKSELRCAAGVDAARAPNVPALLAAEK